MPKKRHPIEKIIADGKKHLTKKEIEKRRAEEPKVYIDGITIPSFLTPKQKVKFKAIVDELLRMKIMSNVDSDAVARYVMAQTMYEETVRQLRLKKNKDDFDVYEKLTKRLDTYSKQATKCATELGLTIASRCRITIKSEDGDYEKPEAPIRKPTKFDKFVIVNGGIDGDATDG